MGRHINFEGTGMKWTRTDTLTSRITIRNLPRVRLGVSYLTISMRAWSRDQLECIRDIQVTLDMRKRWHITDNPTAPDARNGEWKEIVWRFDDQVDSNTSTGRGIGFGFLSSLSANDRIILMARELVCSHHRLCKLTRYILDVL